MRWIPPVLSLVAIVLSVLAVLTGRHFALRSEAAARRQFIGGRFGRERAIARLLPAGTAVHRERLIRDQRIETAARRAVEALDAGRRRRKGRPR